MMSFSSEWLTLVLASNWRVLLSGFGRYHNIGYEYASKNVSGVIISSREIWCNKFVIVRLALDVHRLNVSPPREIPVAYTG